MLLLEYLEVWIMLLTLYVIVLNFKAAQELYSY